MGSVPQEEARAPSLRETRSIAGTPPPPPRETAWPRREREPAGTRHHRRLRRSLRPGSAARRPPLSSGAPPPARRDWLPEPLAPPPRRARAPRAPPGRLPRPARLPEGAARGLDPGGGGVPVLGQPRNERAAGKRSNREDGFSRRGRRLPQLWCGLLTTQTRFLRESGEGGEGSALELRPQGLACVSVSECVCVSVRARACAGWCSNRARCPHAPPKLHLAKKLNPAQRHVQGHGAGRSISRFCTDSKPPQISFLSVVGEMSGS